MKQVVIPQRLRNVLAGSEFEAPTIALVAAVETVLGDNAMPFFPAYTDHGTEHVELVLGAAVKLIPDAVWNQKLLQPADAAVLICASILHDLAMHVREPGFVELVEAGTRFEPRPWFSQGHMGRAADVPWPQLWAEFQREARHFGTSQLELIFGPAGCGVPAVAHADELRPERWTDSDRLLIGEFLRRHHARLSHEIAMHGFPGTHANVFPVLANDLPQLADAVGSVARSHNEPLRLMVEYLEYIAPGSRRPVGALLAYHMGLLRVADYLQVEAKRAPTLLLRLKAPQSPQSVAEWNKHGAVSSISWENLDQSAIYVTVSPLHGLRTHLGLGDLFNDLQRELDTTTAVLSEQYAAADLAALRLTRVRVRTNLGESSLHAQLPYLPRRAALRSDADLFRLVIGDLYGNQPAVAGRELIQNAVDAVRARRTWEERAGTPTPADELRDLKADIVVTLEEHDDGRCVLRVADRGVGMTPDVVIDYYLQAGASFAPTPAEIDELDSDQARGTIRAGRFGVGAFAAFLLGPEMQVATRHVNAKRGVTFRARIDEDLVQLDWANVPVGTEVVIPFDAEVIPSRSWRTGDDGPGTPTDLLKSIASFYRLRDPSIAFIHQTNTKTKTVTAPADVPAPGRRLPDRWRGVRCEGVDAVLWRVPRRLGYMDEFHSDKGGLVAHNGVVIGAIDESQVLEHGAYTWSDATLQSLLRCPSIAVFDSRHVLGVALHRYSLAETVLPFEGQLLESVGADVVAHALVAGAQNHPLQEHRGFSPVFSRVSWMPLLPSLLRRYLRGPLLVLWHHDDVLDWPTSTFIAPRGALSWSGFAHRAHVKLNPPNLLNRETAEISKWGHTLDAVSRSAADWEHKLAARALATVVVRGDPPPGDGVPTAVPRDSRGLERELQRPLPWRRFGDARADGGPGIFLDRAEAVDPELERNLIDAARALKPGYRQPSIVVTAFGNFSQEASAHEHVTSAWVRTVGGGLERGPRKRQAVADAATAGHGFMRPLVNKWRRTVQERE